MLRNLFAVITACILAAGCTTTTDTGSRTSTPAAGQEAHSATAKAQPARARPAPTAEAVQDDLWVTLRAGLRWQDIERAEVDRERERYLAQHNYFDLVGERAAYYLKYIADEVERRDMPMEVALLPLVESTLDPFATSPNHAAGLWQIMPATGRHLGLRQDWWYDGRRDLRDSTRAALDYLEALHRDFDGDWMLALAAYNSGGGRVASAQRSNARRGKPTDFWSLSLPRETRYYLPRLLALSQIIGDPERYGVELPPLANTPAFTVVATGGQLELSRAALLAGVEPAALRALNPGQLRWATSPDAAQELLVPVGSETSFNAGIAALDPEQRVRWDHYRIRRGDSLIRIARKFDTEVALLREVNSIRGNLIRAGDTLMIPSGGDWSGSLAMTANGKAQKRGYKVRRGDSLYRIAGRFKVSIDDIIAWNSLDPEDYLRPGQQLTLYVGGM
ncbi:LysM peptidoglycan-binding domain-containing protein [Mangrovimicrobium sediminis]|uniref:LysM peptidoglycan-binding domain-containing protein n=1 Tax=Mangrovimicrobium sediminis TaxID=2562682 RepID=A0A4Z0M6M2_9GAMM|nr:LysM peptidoglycan-binding domain-containing protein [Haliea sp. SAOS-164]TGD75322.1 LysM peptidoglycan-binding domain-containing protein [Haliea sp. SAOS-164]